MIGVLARLEFQRLRQFPAGCCGPHPRKPPPVRVDAQLGQGVPLVDSLLLETLLFGHGFRASFLLATLQLVTGAT